MLRIVFRFIENSPFLKADSYNILAEINKEKYNSAADDKDTLLLLKADSLYVLALYSIEKGGDSIKTEYYRAVILNNLGEVHTKMEKFEPSINFLRQSEAISNLQIKQNKDSIYSDYHKRNIGYVFHAMANLYEATGETDSAICYLEKSHEYRKSQKNKFVFEWMLINFSYGTFLISQNEKNSLEYLTIAQSEARKTKNVSWGNLIFSKLINKIEESEHLQHELRKQNKKLKNRLLFLITSLIFALICIFLIYKGRLKIKKEINNANIQKEEAIKQKQIAIQQKKTS